METKGNLRRWQLAVTRYSITSDKKESKMSKAEHTTDPEKKENQPSEKKAYVKPAIEEETALPTATARELTPVAGN